MRRLVQRAGAINYQSTQSSCNKTKPWTGNGNYDKRKKCSGD
jgi:hypothetical protein